MARKYIRYVKNGAIQVHVLSKPQAPRKLRTWQVTAARAAQMLRVAYFLFHYNGCWHAMRTFDASRIKTFPNDADPAVAEMWLLHHNARLP